MNLILASQSTARREMLTAAHVPHVAVSAGVDEAAAKVSYAAAGLSARDTADALAELKARRVSASHPNALVLGCDSVVELSNARLLDKPESETEAAAQLTAMSGATHDLYTAAVIVENGRPVWRHIDRARMHMRILSSDFIKAYLELEWPAISGCVGCYRIEGPGAQLFARIDGSHFTIRGLPMLPLLDYLRIRGVLTA